MGWKAIDPPLQHWNIASRVLQLIKEMANRQKRNQISAGKILPFCCS